METFDNGSAFVGRYGITVGGVRASEEAQFLVALRAERREAYKRAEALLLEHLGAQAREDYLRSKEFNVRGSNGRLYRINTRHSYNVTRDDGASFCAIPRHDCSLPAPDIQLALKVWIESNADGYHDVAIPGEIGAMLPTGYPPQMSRPLRLTEPPRPAYTRRVRPRVGTFTLLTVLVCVWLWDIGYALYLLYHLLL